MHVDTILLIYYRQYVFLFCKKQSVTKSDLFVHLWNDYYLIYPVIWLILFYLDLYVFFLNFMSYRWYSVEYFQISDDPFWVVKWTFFLYIQFIVWTSLIYSLLIVWFCNCLDLYVVSFHLNHCSWYSCSYIYEKWFIFIFSTKFLSVHVHFIDWLFTCLRSCLYFFLFEFL